MILPDPSIYKESLKKDHVIPFLGLQRMDANGNTIATKLKMHEECSIIIQRVYVNQTKKNKYQELEYVYPLHGGCVGSLRSSYETVTLEHWESVMFVTLLWERIDSIESTIDTKAIRVVSMCLYEALLSLYS